MRDSGITHYNFCNKSHLLRLPNLLEVSPRVENPSKRLLMLLPLFQSHKAERYVTEGGGIGAVWSRHSWLTNTDAVEHGIEIKFYIEDKVKDDAMPILKASSIDMDDVLFFNAKEFEHETIPRNYGKKIAAFVDPQFKEYDWILMIDADIFAVSEIGEKVPFFDAFFKGCVEGQIGNPCSMVREEGVPINWTSRFSHPLETPYDEAQARWRRVAETLVDKEQLAKFWDPEITTMIAGGGMHAYPAKTMMQNIGDLEWFRHTAQVLQDDEPVIALWYARGKPVWDLRERVKFNEVFIGPTINGSDYEDFKKFINEDIPFIFHYSMNPIEIFWRYGIHAAE